MSLLAPPTSGSTPHRKRTSSFCTHRANKAPRLSSDMGLRRTESYITLTEFRPSAPPATPASPHDQSAFLPYHRSLRYYKELRQRQKAHLNRTLEPITIYIRTETPSQPPVRQFAPAIPKPPPPARKPVIASPPPPPPPPVVTPRKSSPLAPSRSPLPGRPVFPRSKAEPDLLRKAITTRMKESPEGQKILSMGPRLAVSIMAATKDLERIVAARTDKEKEPQDVPMPDAPLLTKSWVVVPGEDWEMVDSSA